MLPEFRYYPDPLGTEAFEQGAPHVCQCCGRETEIWYEFPFYTTEDGIDCICPDCIASGAAAEKFDGDFQSEFVGEVSDPAKIEEWMKRTPGICTIQDTPWYAHCDDFCAFVGYVKWEDLEEMGIADEIAETYDPDVCGFTLDDLKEGMRRGCCIQGYLFRCLHCGKHFLTADVD